LIPNLPATPNGSRIVSIAQSQNGARYTWAGVSPATGFDCSGFVYWVFNTFGYTLDRTMPEQFSAGRRVRLEDLRPGDIVFYADTYTTGLSHNGIYIGEGKFIHAVDESTGVAITPMSAAYWDQRFVGAVRVID
jgi:cell wall-associated NlpC family hydrolase